MNARFGRIVDWGAVTIAIGALIVLGALEDGIRASFRDDPTAYVIHHRDSNEDTSVIPAPLLDHLFADASRAPQRLSFEYLRTIPFRFVSGRFAYVHVRGVDEAAFHAREVTKSPDQPLTNGIWLGSALVDQVESVGSLRIDYARAPIVGVIGAGGRAAESEVWCDRAWLLRALAVPDDAPRVSVVRFRSEAAPPPLSAEAAKVLTISSAVEYRLYQLEGVAFFLSCIRWSLAVAWIVVLLGTVAHVWRATGPIRAQARGAASFLVITSILGALLALPILGHRQVLEEQGLVVTMHLSARVGLWWLANTVALTIVSALVLIRRSRKV